MRQVPVLIVGGGITGLSCALFLAAHQVPCLLVERHPDLLSHPRARGITPRTMELYRQVGLEESILAAAFAGSDFAWVPVRAETLSDEVYETPDEPSESDGAEASPCSFGPIDQDRLEDLVRSHARRLGAELRFSTELTDFTQDDSGVTAVLTDRATGASEQVRASYLVAADGFHSPIRHRLGVPADGPGRLFDTITAIVDADLRPALRGRRATIAYLQRPRPYTIMMAHDAEGPRWVFGTGHDPSREPIESFTDERVAAMVREAAGLPDVEVRLRPQIPGTDMKVLAFPIGAHVARNYRVGRVFFIGDAAHVWPPTGGLGANAGIQDAHNLAWKLALVTAGAAGPGLLDSYEAERRPTGLMTMGQALARFGTRMGPGSAPEIVEYGAVALGYRYRSAAVLGGDEDGDTTPLLPRELRGQVGTRAPHVPVERGGRRISTLDLYGSRFVLLTGPDGDAWAKAAKDLPLPVDVYRLGVDLASDTAAEAHDLAPGEAILVRPDGFVAWRSTDPGALAGALAAILCR